MKYFFMRLKHLFRMLDEDTRKTIYITLGSIVYLVLNHFLIVPYVCDTIVWKEALPSLIEYTLSTLVGFGILGAILLVLALVLSGVLYMMLEVIAPTIKNIKEAWAKSEPEELI